MRMTLYKTTARRRADALTAAAAALTLLLASPAIALAAGEAADSTGTDSTAQVQTQTPPADQPATPAPAKTEAKGKGKKKAKGAKKGAAVTETKKVAAGTMPVAPATTPEHVQVQHILIGFAGSVPGKDVKRTREEAKKLAYEILDRARTGEDFGALVQKYTDDSPPGIYGMSGRGVAPAPGEYSRDGMVPAFGNVGFAISPGNIGIADYDPASSPYGWHVIKRLK